MRYVDYSVYTGLLFAASCMLSGRRDILCSSEGGREREREMEVLVGVLTHARLETYDLNYSPTFHSSRRLSTASGRHPESDRRTEKL